MKKAKEKAKVLVEKMQRSKDMNYQYAKQCALIAVEEILESSPSLPILSDSGYFADDIGLSTNYWMQVKIEIDKL